MAPGWRGLGRSPWPGQGEVPSLEGFDVLHQLLAVVLRQGVQGHLTETCGLAGPERPLSDATAASRTLTCPTAACFCDNWPSCWRTGLIASCGRARPQG